MLNFLFFLTLGIAMGAVVTLPVLLSPVRRHAIWNRGLRAAVSRALAIVSAVAAFGFLGFLISELQGGFAACGMGGGAGVQCITLDSMDGSQPELWLRTMVPPQIRNDVCFVIAENTCELLHEYQVFAVDGNYANSNSSYLTMILGALLAAITSVSVFRLVTRDNRKAKVVFH